MVAVTNLRRDRAVIVRTGWREDGSGDKQVRILPGQTVDVPGFSTKLPKGGRDDFHAGLVEAGDISVGAKAAEAAETSDDKNAQLLADLEAAQRAVQAADTAAAEAIAAKDADPSPANKAAAGQAAQAAKKARADLDKAQKAFDAGA